MSGPIKPFVEAIAAWNPASRAADVAAAEALRVQVVANFPLADWPSMPLDRYALGTEDSLESFCYAMEFGTRQLGSMAGGSSRKHLILKRRDTGEWYF